MNIDKLEICPLKSLRVETPDEKYVCLLPEEYGHTWEELLTDKYNEEEPGLGTERIFGLQFELNFNGKEITFSELNKFITSFFNSIFPNGNLLSVRGIQNDEGFYYMILAFPLVRRALHPQQWIDKINADTYVIKEEYMNKFYSSFESSFSVSLVHNAKTSIKSTDIIASIDLITDMDVPSIKESDYEELIYDAKGYDQQLSLDMSYEKFSKICTHVISYFTTGVEKNLYIRAQNRDISAHDFMLAVEHFILKQYPEISESDKNHVLDKTYSAVFGNYVLDALLDAEDISDIKVLDPSHIRVKCNGKRMTSNISFIDGQDYFRYINSLAIRNGLDLVNEAFHVFTDSETNEKFIMRFNITTPYVNSSPFPYLHIRKIKKEKYTMEDLIRMQCMPRKVAEYLIWKINTSSMLICGKGGSGKTTVVNTLIDSIHYDQSGLVIQESEELHSSRHPDFMFQHITRSRNGRPAYDLKDEAKNGLLTDLDYFIIGEIKGGEALYFLNAASTGHKCICTIHAPSSLDAIDKMADYVMYESSYTKEQAVYMLKEMKVIVYIEHFKIKEISEVTGWDNEKKCLIYRTVYKL